MEQHDGHTHLTEEEASGGSKEGVVRWVLLGGLILAIGLLTITWVIPAMMHGDVAAEGDVSGKIQAAEADSGDSTDGIVSDAAASPIPDATTINGVPVVENQPEAATTTAPAAQ